MKIRELFLRENVFDQSKPEHLRMMADIDNFTAAPAQSLKSTTIDFLKTRNKKSGTRKLFRILFSYDLIKLADALKVDKIDADKKCIHSSTRPTSWTISQQIAERLAAEDDLGDYAVILESVIPATAVLLDTAELTTTDRTGIYLFDQSEVIIDAGTYESRIVKVMDLN